MMDLKLFSDLTYSLAIITIFAALFAAYGMLLMVTQYMQNVRGFSPTDAGFLLLPYSMSLMIVSLTAGKLVGVIGSRRLILLGMASQIVGFAVLTAGLQVSTVVVVAGLVFVGVGAGLCLTPITSLAMTTTGGTSLFAPPPVQAALGRGIASFATAGTIGHFLPGGAGLTNQALQASEEYGSTGPQNPRGFSPSSYGQRQGSRRMARRRGGYMVSPPAAGLPPSQTGFINRPRPRPRRYYA